MPPLQTGHFTAAIICPFLAMACTAATSHSGRDVERHTSTAGGHYNIRVTTEVVASSDSLDATVDEAWHVLRSVYDELEIPLGGIDLQRMELGNARFKPRRIGGTRLSQYLDCGRSVGVASYADSYEVTLSLITRILAGDDGRAVVTIGN